MKKIIILTLALLSLLALGFTTSYSYGNIEDYITFDESTGTITDYHRRADGEEYRIACL